MKSMSFVVPFLATTVAALGPIAAPAAQGRPARSAFTLHSRVTSYQAGGELATSDKTLYLASDGRFRIVEAGPDGSVKKELVFDPARGVFSVDRLRKVLVPEPVEFWARGAVIPRTADELRNDRWYVRTEVLLGLTAYVHRYSSGDTPVLEQYYVPELRGFPLKYVRFTDGAPATLIEPVNVDFGEPDTALLRLPEYPVVEREPVSAGALDAKAERKPQPAYPDAARAAGITGSVTVRVLVNGDGAVEKAEAITGHPLLRPAAEDAALHTYLSQTIAEGRPAKATGTLTFAFPPEEASVPADLAYASDFIEALRASGMTVTSVDPSRFGSLFTNTNRAAFIVTNKGAIEAFFFHGATDADRIRVRSEEVKEGASPYHYVIEGQPTRGRSGEWAGSRPVYFYARRNLFVISWEKDTDEAVRQALARP
jgi:TonB family protein